MAHIDPTVSLDTVSSVSAAELDAATYAHVLIVVDGEFKRLDLNTLLGLNQSATTTELADVADAINVTNKYIGKRVYNTTTGIVVYADAASAAGTWSEADGSVEHSPA